MTDDGYINRAFRPEPGRKYYNHIATHTAGEWLRYGLLSSGQYIKTSDPDEYGRWRRIWGHGAELPHRILDLTNTEAEPARRKSRWGEIDYMIGLESSFTPDEEIDALTCHCGRIACRHHEEDA